MWRRLVGGLMTGALAAGLVAAPPAAARTAPAPSPKGLPPAGESYDVTLPTGDKVHVSPGGATTVTPAPRRSGRRPTFSISQRAGDLYVVPDDQRSADPARFDVSALHERRKPAGMAPKQAGEGLVTIRAKGIARDGRTGRGEFYVLNVKDGTRGESRRLLPGDPAKPCTDAGWDDSACIRVPPGTYSILGFIDTMPGRQSSTAEGIPLNRSFVGYPEITITKDTSIVLDARKAVEVKIDTPDHLTKRNLGALSHLMWTRTPEKGPASKQGLLTGPGSLLEERVFLQPTARVRTGSFEVYTRWRLEAPAITMRARRVPLSPEYYEPAYFSDFSTQFPRLDGTVRLRVADGDRPGTDLRGKLALVRRSDRATVAQLSNKAAAAGARMVAIYNDKPGVNADPGGSGIKLKVPTVRLSHEQGRALLAGRHGATVTATGRPRSPYLYELVYPHQGRIPADLRHVARTRSLARVVNDYHGATTMSTGRYSMRPWEDYSMAITWPFEGAPRSRVEYLTPDRETAWSARAAVPEEPYNNVFPRPETPYVRLDEARWSTYRPGARRSWSWFKAPLAGGMNPLTPIARRGDEIRVRVGLVDAAGNYSNAYSSNFPNGFVTAFRMFRGKELIAETPNLPSGYVTVPPAASTYRIEYDVDNHAVWASLSTRSKTTWTFRSARPSGDQIAVLPLLQVGYDAHLDLQNRTRSRFLKLTVAHQDGSRTPVRRLTLAVSYDDGTTWTQTPVHRTHHGYFAWLPRSGTVSLRIQAEDTAGNGITQEVIRAYQRR